MGFGPRGSLKRRPKRPGLVSRELVRVVSRAWGPGEFLVTSARARVTGPGLPVAMATAGGPTPRTRAGGTGPELRGESRVVSGVGVLTSMTEFPLPGLEKFWSVSKLASSRYCGMNE